MVIGCDALGVMVIGCDAHRVILIGCDAHRVILIGCDAHRVMVIGCDAQRVMVIGCDIQRVMVSFYCPIASCWFFYNLILFLLHSIFPRLSGCVSYFNFLLYAPMSQELLTMAQH